MNGEQKTQIWIGAGFLILVVIIVIVAAFASKGSSAASSSAFVSTTAAPITSGDWSRGATSSKVTLIEYGDFQCPACGAYEPLVEELYGAYKDKVLFVFRNFPLTQVHQNAMIAAQAAEAAGMQGKYWEMHDLLYQKQNDWGETATASVVVNYFDKYAQSLGLDVSKFDADMNSDTVKAKIQKDIASGTAASIDHTPTFFINLQQIQNPNGYAQLQSDIDSALASSTIQ